MLKLSTPHWFSCNCIPGLMCATWGGDDHWHADEDEDENDANANANEDENENENDKTC